MKKRKNVLSVIALTLALAMCLCMTGCSAEMLNEVLGSYMDTAQEQEYIGADGDIYSLSIFDDLPETTSDMDPLFWVAEGEAGNKVYFLGSIHCADDKAYRIPDKIMNAYLESDALAVECDIIAFESDFTAQLSSMSYLMYTDGSSIEDHIDPELYTALVDFYENNPSDTLASYGYTIDTLNRCRPAMWQSAIETIVCDAADLYSDYGIDSHFLKIASAQGKEIIELESVESQYSMLSGFSDELNEMLLWGYVSYTLDEQAQSLRDTYEAWLIGDGSVLIDGEQDYTGYTQEEIEQTEALLDEYYSAMLYDRNALMTDKAEDMITSGQNVFYVVGAAHMVDETGIITQLRSRGYTVTQLGGIDDSNCTGGDNGNSTADTTTTTTAATTTADTSTYGTNYDDMYDLYVELYEHFGGTTAAAEDQEATTSKTTTTRTTRTTAADNDDENDGYDGWGYSG